MNLRARKRVFSVSRNRFGGFLLIWLLAAICCRAQSSYEGLVSRAQAALRDNNPDQAILLCQAAIQAVPSRWEAYFAAGNVYSAEQRYDDATDMLQKALLRAPEEKRQPIRVALADVRSRYWSQFSENGQSHGGSDPALAQQGVATMGTAPRTGATNRPAAPSPTQAEVVLWKTIEKSERVEDFQAYLRAYPNGAFASLAEERVKALQPTASVRTSVQSPKNGQIIGAIVSQGGVRPLANEIHISPSYDSLISQARAALNQKKAKESVALSEQATRLDDKRWEAYVIAASGLSAQQLYDDAIGMLQMALPRAPEEKKQLIRDAVADTRKLLATSATPTTAPPAKPSAADPLAGAAAPSQAEVVLWKTIENSDKPEDYGAYLSRYPNGAFAGLASARMERLQNLSPEELHARKVKQLLNTHWIGSRQWEKKSGKVWSIGKFQLTFTDETKCNSDDGGDFRACTWSLSGDEVHVSMVGTKELCPVEMDGKLDGDKLTGAFLQPRRMGWNACEKRQGEWELTRSAEGSR